MLAREEDSVRALVSVAGSGPLLALQGTALLAGA